MWQKPNISLILYGCLVLKWPWWAFNKKKKALVCIVGRSAINSKRHVHPLPSQSHSSTGGRTDTRPFLDSWHDDVGTRAFFLTLVWECVSIVVHSFFFLHLDHFISPPQSTLSRCLPMHSLSPCLSTQAARQQAWRARLAERGHGGVGSSCSSAGWVGPGLRRRGLAGGEAARREVWQAGHRLLRVGSFSSFFSPPWWPGGQVGDSAMTSRWLQQEERGGPWLADLQWRMQDESILRVIMGA